MKQSKRASLIESLTNVAVGSGVALGSQVLVFPLFGLFVPISTNVEIMLIFTGISIARSFLLRRAFEFLRVRGLLP